MPTRQQMFLELIQNPSRENYVRLWEAVTTDPGYAPYADPFDAIQDLIEAGEPGKARAALRPVLGDLLLSPRVHVLAALAAKESGDEQAANLERLFYARCLEAILATGDGTPESPYLVTRISDEYDVLISQGKQMRAQSLRVTDGRSLDVIDCTDGSTLCFDITRATAAAAAAAAPERREGSPQRRGDAEA